MIGGAVLYLAGTLTGIVATACSLAFFHFINDVKVSIENMSTRVINLQSLCDNIKNHLSTEFGHINKKIDTLNKTVADLKVEEPSTLIDSGTLDSRNI